MNPATLLLHRADTLTLVSIVSLSIDCFQNDCVGGGQVAVATGTQCNTVTWTTAASLVRNNLNFLTELLFTSFL